MWSVADYLEVVDRAVQRLEMLVEMIPEDDQDSKVSVEQELSVLGELKLKLEIMTAQAVQNATIH